MTRASFTALLLAFLPPALTGAPERQPAVLPGLAWGSGLQTRQVAVSLTDANGQPRPEAEPAVDIIAPVAWSPEDPVRDGAAEFELLLRAARLLDRHALAGLVAVGNRHGVLSPGVETSIRHLVHLGLPVVRLADSGRVAPTGDDLLINGGSLSAAEARGVLLLCLRRHGTLPPVRDPERPTAAEVALLRRHVTAYQQHFDTYAAQTGSGGLIIARH